MKITLLSGIAYLTTGITGAPEWVNNMTLLGALVAAVLWFAKREKARERKMDALQQKMYDLSMKSSLALNAVADHLKRNNEILEGILKKIPSPQVETNHK